MKVNVRTYGDLMRALGERFTVELEDGATVRGLISKLGEKMGTPGSGFLGHYNLSGSTLTVLVNGRNIHALRGPETGLKDGDTVTFMPLVVGGQI